MVKDGASDGDDGDDVDGVGCLEADVELECCALKKCGRLGKR